MKINLEYKAVIKSLKYISAILIILSIIEFLFIALLNITKITIDTESNFLIAIILSPDYFQFPGIIFYIFNILSIFMFMVLGMYLLNVVINEKIQTNGLAKLLVVIGMVIVLNAFVKMNYLILLGKSKIETFSGTIRFQTAIYNPDISPFSLTIFWFYFLSINCFLMIIGAIIATAGIKWTILITEEQKQTV